MTKFVTLVFILFAILVNGCASVPIAKSIPITNATQRIYVVYRHWHTSIVLDAKQLALHSPALAPYVRDEDFARIGWGDGDYFTGKSKTWGSATKALVASGYSALQLLTYTRSSFDEIPAETIVPLAITDEGLYQLINYINASLVVDSQGKPVQLPSFGEDIGVFFSATGHYSMLNNCNTWTGKALQLAGLPLASHLTAQGVFQQASEISQIQTEARLFKPIYNQ